MKKSLLALAALTAFAGVASAQSSVTLFGVVDAAARNTKNGNAGSIKSLISGGGATSRLGFRGVEDLGGGLRAGFWLEGQVDTDTGGTAFNFMRRSTVSLMGGFGELRLGRDFVPTYTSWGVAEIFGYVGVATTANLRTATGAFVTQNNMNSGVRASNQIMYFLPAMGGLYGSIHAGAGEGSATQDKYVGGRLGYAAGPLNISASAGKTERGTADLDTVNLTGSFNMGFATLVAGYEKNEYSLGSFNNDSDLMTVGLTMPLGNGTLKAQYSKLDGSSSSYDATMFGLGYVYNLSKRTSLYTSFGRINNDGNATTGARFTAGSAGPAGMSGGQTSTGYEFGITHSF